MEDPELTWGTVQDTLILPSSDNGEAVTVEAEASTPKVNSKINKPPIYVNFGSG